MMYYNQNGSDVAGQVGGAASTANPLIAAGKILGELTVDAVDLAKRRQIDYSISQQRLTNELGLAKTAQEQQFSLGKLGILAQAQSGANASGNKPADNSKINLAIGVGGFVVVATLTYLILNR